MADLTMSDLPMNEIDVSKLLGHCELRSWFEFDGEKLIGMGSKKTFDNSGRLIDCSESQTGLVVSFS